MRRLFMLVSVALLLATPAAAQVIQPSPQAVSVQDSGTACANAGTCASWPSVSAYPSVTFQMTGTCGSCTVTFEGTADGQSWFSILTTKGSTGVLSATTTTTGQYGVTLVGLIGVRARLTARASGGFNVTLTRGVASSMARLFDLANVTGVLAAANGGTGQSSYAVGDLLYASATTTLSKLADVAAGSVLVSGGVGVAPAWSVSPSATTYTATSGFLAPNGSVSAPSFAFTSHTNDGLYSAGTGSVSVAASGSHIADFSTAGLDILRDSGRLSMGSATDICLSRSATKTYTVNDCAGGAATLAVVGSAIIPTLQLGANKSNLVAPSDGVLQLLTNAQTHGLIFQAVPTQPTCTSNCGTSPSVAGADSSMTVTMGASGVPASGFVITFGGTWSAAPQCDGGMALAGMAAGKMPLTYVTTTTTLTVVTNGTAPSTSDKYHFRCSLGS